MLLTLLKALNTTKLDEVVRLLAHNMSELDIDVLLHKAKEAGDVEIDKKKNRIKALKEVSSYYYNEKLLEQIKNIIRFYDQEEANITRSRLELLAISPMSNNGYAIYDFECTMLYLDESGSVNKYEISVPKSGKRPFHSFEFYTYLDHQEFGAKAVNEFIDQFNKK